MRRRQLAIVAVALLAVLSGCASFGGGADGGDASADLSADGAPSVGDASGDGGSSGAQSAEQRGGDGGSAAASATTLAVGDRAIVRTGSVALTVESFDATRDAIAAEARRFGGHVGGSGQTLHRANNASWTTGQVVVRVPSDRFSDLVSFVQEQGTVERVETETEDVTDQLVELDARLTNLEAKRNRLRSFYDRADSTNELLSIEERLSAVQGEIEQLKAKKQSLEDRVALSTLRVSIEEERPESAPSATKSSNPTVAAAFLGSIQQLVDAGYGLVLVVAAVAPFAVVLGIPTAVGYGLYRRRRGPRASRGTAATAAPDAGEPSEAEAGPDSADASVSESTSDEE